MMRPALHAEPLPSIDEMYQAVLERDSRYDGIFITAVRTTGIFCRPGCPAKAPARKNVEFHRSPKEALAHGFRPCKRCRPLEAAGTTPVYIQKLLDELEADSSRRFRDPDLRARGIDPVALRRWFKKHHGMTFHAYQRGRRLANAIGQLGNGAAITAAAFDNGYDSLSGFQEALRQITGRSASQSRDATIVHLTRATTPLGPMLIGGTDRGICLVEFTDRRMLETQLKRLSKQLQCTFIPGPNEMTRRMEEELSEYFTGKRTDFETPLVTTGTDFQRRVWSALQEIPFGTTRSYGEQARSIEMPSAVRAVARANGDNKISIVIPCHRVIGADGKLTGYGGGLWRKEWLLRHEGVERVGGGGRAQVELSI